MMTLFSLFDDLLSLFYPKMCVACEEREPAPQGLLCLECLYRLPLTDHAHQRNNAFEQRFWGRLPLEGGAALYQFVKGGRVQRLIHQLKYKGRKEIGHALGARHGAQLRQAPPFDTVDLVVPVPLHPRRLRQRGYNQSEGFAAGLAEAMELPWNGKLLRRAWHADSQTRRSRLARVENVANAFELTAPSATAGKHILLVDDVLTTGATLEACGNCLLQTPDVRLSMATIAIADI
jgi:ComF family protein